MLAEPLSSDDHASAARHTPIIAPDRLKTLRKRRRWSQQELADKAGISRRQVARIESSEEPVPVKPKTLRGLSAALKVKPEELSRERPNADVPMPETESARVGIKVDPQTRLAYDLVQRRYRASPKDVIHLGPLLFVLLAEGCLAWRREKLREVDQAVKALTEASSGASQLYFASYVTDIEFGTGSEEVSIKQADLLGDVHRADDSTWQFNEDDLYGVTPFADYLRKLSDDLELPGAVRFDVPEVVLTEPWGAEPYVVCGDELERMTGGSRKARWALSYGDVRLSEIPAELLPDKATERRVEWLESRLRDDLKAELERQQEAIASLARSITLPPDTRVGQEGEEQ